MPRFYILFILAVFLTVESLAVAVGFVSCQNHSNCGLSNTTLHYCSAAHIPPRCMECHLCPPQGECAKRCGGVTRATPPASAATVRRLEETGEQNSMILAIVIPVALLVVVWGVAYQRKKIAMHKVAKNQTLRNTMTKSTRHSTGGYASSRTTLRTSNAGRGTLRHSFSKRSSAVHPHDDHERAKSAMPNVRRDKVLVCGFEACKLCSIDDLMSSWCNLVKPVVVCGNTCLKGHGKIDETQMDVPLDFLKQFGVGSEVVYEALGELREALQKATRCFGGCGYAGPLYPLLYLLDVLSFRLFSMMVVDPRIVDSIADAIDAINNKLDQQEVPISILALPMDLMEVRAQLEAPGCMLPLTYDCIFFFFGAREEMEAMWDCMDAGTGGDE